MDVKNILVLGTKGTVIAYRRDNGQQLWSAPLKSNGFVSLVTDERRVYAHTGGELFCIDLLTGRAVWHDGLKGMGYDIASLALPGIPTDITNAASDIERKRRAADSTTQTTTQTSS